MEDDVLTEGVLKTVQKERAVLRGFISNVYAAAVGGSEVDIEAAQHSFDRLQIIGNQLYKHHVASDEEALLEQEANRNIEYAVKMQKIREVAKPVVVHFKPASVKLPTVEENEPASWASFRMMIRALEKGSEITENQLLMHLSTALPPAERIHVNGLSFAQAMIEVESRLCSNEKIIDSAKGKLKKARMMPSEREKLKAMLDALEVTNKITNDSEVHQEVFAAAIQILPENVFSNYIDGKNSKSVVDLINYLKVRSEGLGWRREENQQTYGRQMKTGPKKQWRDRGPSENCHFCRLPGHAASDCKELAETLCSKCHLKGHTYKFCKKSNNKAFSSYSRPIHSSGPRRSDVPKWRNPEKPKGEVVEEMNALTTMPTDNRFTFDAEVDGKKMTLLLDTGAKVNMLPESECPVDEEVPSRLFGTADASTSFVARGPVEKTLTTADGTELPLTTYVGNSRVPLIGRDFINLYDVKWNDRGLSGQFNGRPFYLKDEPPIEEILNEAEDNVFLVMPEDLEEDEEPRTEMICTDNRLAELVSEWSDLAEGLGHTKVAKHYIPTDPNAPPICRPERRFPVALMGKARTQIKEMLGLGVIQTSTSENCFQIRPVAKKDGSLRVCIDFRPLNEITTLDAYPMPRVDETIEKLAGASIFSKIDLVKGYYQMEINEADRHKTAFRFDGQLYEFVRMPFGLASAPQSFMRLMNLVLGDLPFVAIYLDDVTIYSKLMDEHLDHVRQVFSRLRQAGLKINKNKCEFGVSAVNFLGFKIENNSRRPSDEKTEAMRTFPTPTNSQDVHRFVGLTNYFRGLIPEFAHTAAPLYELLKPKCKFEWQPRHEKAFIKLKELMTSDPVVRLPNLEKPFIVKTDACDTGMGAVLLQEEDGVRHIIEYASKRFNATQMRYPIIEKEATAIMWAISKWKPYLWGTPFKIETDHRPLAWLKSKTDCDGKLGNMARRLAEFQRFDIEYIPGKSNEDADAMSRIVAIVTTDDGNEDIISDDVLTEHPEWFTTDETGVTFYIADGKKRRWVATDKRMDVLQEVHDKNCHMGIDRTLALLRSRVFWPGWAKDVKRYIKQCHLCATIKQTPIETAEMMPVKTEEVEMLDQWSMDIAGPLPPTPSGNKYIIAAQERFSKWPEASAVKMTDAKAVIRWLDENIIKRFGVPKQLTTDRGPQFESREFRNFLEQLNITHRLGAPYHHQSNGLAERFNRSIEQLIRAGPGEEDGKWDEDLHRALAAYRHSEHSITRVSPFEAIMGQPPRLELDAKLNTVAPVTATRTETHRVIKDKLAQAEERMKKTYDKRCRAQSARNLDGLRVYWRVPVRKNKLARTYKGPFVAQKTDNPLNYLIRGDGRVTKTVHVNQLKQCYNDEAPLDTLRDRGRPTSTAGGVARRA